MANPFQSNVVTGMGNIGRRACANDCFRLQWLIATFTLYPFSDIIHPKVGLFCFPKEEVSTAEGQWPVFRMGNQAPTQLSREWTKSDY